MKNIAAFSGGKDSTAMVLKEAERGAEFELPFTPAGNEPPELFEHVNRIAGAMPGLHFVNRGGDSLEKERQEKEGDEKVRPKR